MVNFTTTTNKALDNKVTLNGAITYTLSDDEITRVKSILDGIVADRGVVNTTSSSFVTASSEKPQYVATKDFATKYEVKAQTIKGTSTKMYCISRANGWTKAEKACLNDAIKALEGIKEIEVEYKDKDDKTKTFKAWGYPTKKKAEEMMATLPKVIKAKVLNARFPQ